MLINWKAGMMVFRNDGFIDKFAENVEVLIRIKEGLFCFAMHSDSILDSLTKVNDDKIFELDNLIAFLHIAKNKTINPVSRATVGLMNDGDWAAIKKNVFG